MKITDYHIPVLLNQSIDGLKIKPDGIYIDTTFGGGGHSRAILEKLKNGRLIAFDRDQDAMKSDLNDPRFTLINHNFIYMTNFLRFLEIDKVDGIIADLGVSSHQFDTPKRGFSYRFDADLDMRMDHDLSASARDILESETVENIALILKTYGEIKNARAIAKSIIERRNAGSIITTSSHLQNIIVRFAKGHDAVMKLTGLVYQSLRIAVNDEINALKKLLISSAQVLGKGGRLVVISYHSLEDRLVKNFLKHGNLEGFIEQDMYGNSPNELFRMVTKKAIIPVEQEVLFNNRARSAKLRIAEKIY